MNSFVAIEKLRKKKKTTQIKSSANYGLSILIISKQLGLSLDELNRIKLHTLLDIADEKTRDGKDTKRYGNPNDFSNYF